MPRSERNSKPEARTQNWVSNSRSIRAPGRMLLEPILHLRFKPRCHLRVGLQSHQLARDVRVEKVHCLVELGSRRTGGAMPLLLDFLQNLENRIVVWDAIGIVVTAVWEPLKAPSICFLEAHSVFRQGITNRPLFRHRQAFDQFNDVQGRRAHAPKLAVYPDAVNVQARPREGEMAANAIAGASSIRAFTISSRPES